MPVVTVPSSPSGEPMATTSWPTRRFPDDPSVIGARPVAPDGLHDGDVAAGIGADHLERRGGAVGEGDLGLHAARRRAGTAVGGRHHVVVRQDEAVGGQDDAGALLGLPAHVGLELDHAGDHLGGHLLDRTCRKARGGHARRGVPRSTNCSDGRPGCTSVATPPPMPADTTAMASAPTVNRPARERFCGDVGGRRASSGSGSTGRYGSCGAAVGGLRLLGGVAPVVGLLRVGTGAVLAGVARRRGLVRARPLPVAAVAASTSDGSSLRLVALLSSSLRSAVCQ